MCLIYHLRHTWALRSVRLVEKICVITGTRAEFGLMQKVLGGLKSANDVELQLIVTGAHLVADHGLTNKEIHAAGFEIDAEVDMLLREPCCLGV